MRTRLLAAVLMVLTLFVSSVLSSDLFSGTWKMNIEKSTFSPGPILKPIGPNFTTIQAVDNGLKFVSDGVDAKGRTTHGEFTVTFDGTDSFYPQLVLVRPDPDSAPPTVSLKTINDRTHELP